MMEIYDNILQKVIVRGKTPYNKDNDASYHRDMHLVSFDGKWYFNLDSERFSHRQIKGLPEVRFDESTIDQYEWCRWNEKTPKLYDIYRENGYDELDEEIKDLVYEMNRWKGIVTYGSCSGHGTHQAWVSFHVYDVIAFDRMLRPLRTPRLFPKLKGKFRLSLGDDYMNGVCNSAINYSPDLRIPHSTNDDGDEGAYFVLATNRSGKLAWDDVDEYTKVLSIIREEDLL